MLNTGVYNSTTLNNLFTLPSLSDKAAIEFNGYSLQSANIITSILLHDSMPERDLATADAPRSDGKIINGDNWRKKTITLSGTLHTTTAAEMVALINTFKKNVSAREGNLDIRDEIDSTNYRRYIATAVGTDSMFSARVGTDITRCPFTVTFEADDPFGKDLTYTSELFESETDLTFTEEIENLGSAPGKPVFILNFSAASSISAINITNNTTGESIQIAESISAGDYVRFDSENQEVTINGVPVTDYAGVFPEMASGVNNFTVTLTGTSATYDLTVKFFQSYF